MLKNLENCIKPKNLNEAVKILNREKNSAVISGGTDLFLFNNDAISTLVDITGLNLNHITQKGKFLAIGAGTAFNDIAASPVLKKFANGIIAKAAKSCAYNNIRNLATIGGNIASSLSSADLVPALLVLDAKLKIKGARKLRAQYIVPLHKFFIDHKKNILKKEIITEIIISAEYENANAFFVKFSRTKNDIALVNCACLLEVKNNIVKKLRLALGCCAPTPVRIYQAEKFLHNKELSQKNINAALKIIGKTVKPVTDHRASGEYRREIAKELFLRCVKIN